MEANQNDAFEGDFVFQLSPNLETKLVEPWQVLLQNYLVGLRVTSYNLYYLARNNTCT